MCTKVYTFGQDQFLRDSNTNDWQHKLINFSTQEHFEHNYTHLLSFL